MLVHREKDYRFFFRSGKEITLTADERNELSEYLLQDDFGRPNDEFPDKDEE